MLKQIVIIFHSFNFVFKDNIEKLGRYFISTSNKNVQVLKHEFNKFNRLNLTTTDLPNVKHSVQL